MKTKNLVLISALGLLCAVFGLFRYWILVSVAFALPGLPVGNRLNVDAWISFTTGCLGVALLVGVGIGCLGTYQAIGLRNEVHRFLVLGGTQEISYFGRESTVNSRMFGAFICLLPVAFISSGIALLNGCWPRKNPGGDRNEKRA
jgi:hypothetical protein